jgi:hypothetical protein
MVRQINMFSQVDTQDAYTKKVEAPIYKITGKKPMICELFDKTTFIKLAKEIDANVNITDEEKIFLLEAAKRHIIFNYENIAEYYAHASKDMQDLMEKSALVIIDFDKAIEHNFVKLSNEIKSQYLEEYQNNDIE